MRKVIDAVYCLEDHEIKPPCKAALNMRCQDLYGISEAAGLLQVERAPRDGVMTPTCL